MMRWTKKDTADMVAMLDALWLRTRQPIAAVGWPLTDSHLVESFRAGLTPEARHGAILHHLRARVAMSEERERTDVRTSAAWTRIADGEEVVARFQRLAEAERKARGRWVRFLERVEAASPAELPREVLEHDPTAPR